MARIRLATIPNEISPPAGQISIYAKADNNLYLKTPAGNEYLIYSTGNSSVGGGYQAEQVAISNAQATAKEITLNSTPSEPTRTLLFIDGAAPAFYGLDYTVTGNILSWNGLRLDGLLAENDLIRIVYF